MSRVAETFSFASVPELAGRRFEGDTFVLGQHDVEGFERATWLDRAYPEPDPPEFPEGIVEGFYSLALLDFIHTTLYRVSPTESYAFNYGLDRVRFPSPMRVGDEIASKVRVESVERRGQGFLIRTDCELRVVGAAKPGLTAQWITLTLPRAGFELEDDAS